MIRTKILMGMKKEPESHKTRKKLHWKQKNRNNKYIFTKALFSLTPKTKPKLPAVHLYPVSNKYL